MKSVDAAAVRWAEKHVDVESDQKTVASLKAVRSEPFGHRIHPVAVPQ